MSTFADLTGINLPKESRDGILFLPELLDENQSKHEFLYWEYFSTDYKWSLDFKTLRNQLKRQALRLGKWKAIRHNIHKTFKDMPV